MMTDTNHIPAEELSVLDKQTTDTNLDPRHQKRIRLMQALFSYSFDQEFYLPQEDKAVFDQIVQRLAEIDPQVQDHAPERPLTDINRVDLAILRLATYEAIHTKVPTKVIINEAVELAKEFGTQSSPKFVNGVLGQLLTQKHRKDKQDKQDA